MRSKNVVKAVPFIACALAFAASLPASATIYVGAGADPMVLPVVQAEFGLVYAGQQFNVAGVDSLSSLTGFLNNDCTFGTLQNCGWSPLGSAAAVDAAISVIPLTQAQLAAYMGGQETTSGPLLQFPLYATALAIAAQDLGLTANGQLVLGDGELCGIFSGQLTDWSQFAFSIAAGSFKVVYDSQPGSGATWLLTQHLHAVCDASNSAFTTLPVPVTSDFSSLPIPGGVSGNPRFKAAAGSIGVQAALTAAASSIGYLAPAYTNIAPSSPVTSGLYVASLANAVTNRTFLPTVPNTLIALRNPGAGAVNATPPTTAQIAASPTNWVPQIPTPANGYPIVGYANMVASSCYTSIAPVLLQYLTQPYLPTQHALVISQNGLAPARTVSAAYAKALSTILLSNKSGDNINIQNPQTCIGFSGR